MLSRGTVSDYRHERTPSFGPVADAARPSRRPKLPGHFQNWRIFSILYSDGDRFIPDLQTMNARRGDIVAGLVAVGLVVFVFVVSEEMPDGPAGFPRLIAIGLLICSVILIGRAVWSKKEAPVLFTDIHWPTILLVGGVWIGVIFLVEHLGFLIPGMVFVVLTAWYLLGRPTDKKAIGTLAALVVGVSVVLWVVFHKLLGVGSPSGFFF